ncbi:hypothetical protein BD410DRAFT_836564 [Rickenella mellea]|uniref:Uncharacterized protein n=1 Tax=Rickenella mellea TaxID=50990 RepID=A0A4Y7QGF2_9AGAM|nr:hypothetical protein BD410DRAFT_836564 [Rickenella mellea]
MGRPLFSTSLAPPVVRVAEPEQPTQYEKWSSWNAFDPDSDEFFERDDVVYEAFLTPEQIAAAAAARESLSPTPTSEDGGERPRAMQEEGGDSRVALVDWARRMSDEPTRYPPLLSPTSSEPSSSSESDSGSRRGSPTNDTSLDNVPPWIPYRNVHEPTPQQSSDGGDADVSDEPELPPFVAADMARYATQMQEFLQSLATNHPGPFPDPPIAYASEDADMGMPPLVPAVPEGPPVAVTTGPLVRRSARMSTGGRPPLGHTRSPSAPAYTPYTTGPTRRISTGGRENTERLLARIEDAMVELPAELGSRPSQPVRTILGQVIASPATRPQNP